MSSDRFAPVARQILATTPELRASYLEECRVWDSAPADGLPDEDFGDWPGFEVDDSPEPKESA